MDNRRADGTAKLAAFGGEGVDATATLARQTYNGDATLDGHVEAADYALVSQNYGQTGKRWQDGDFTYDGNVDAEDYSIVGNNYGKNLNAPGGGGGGGAMMAPAAPGDGAIASGEGAAEPALTHPSRSTARRRTSSGGT
jgi:hypothetical protein